MPGQATPLVHLISLGGTIAMSSSTPGRAVAPRLTGEDILAAVPGLDQMGELRLEDHHPIPSGHLQWKHLLALSRRIDAICQTNPEAGVVVTTGTDTLEEAAYFVDLSFPGENCVVFTGAMRDPIQVSPDGPRNLKDALVVAASSACRHLGVLVCLNGEIHAARDVTKTNTVDVATFASPKLGLLGVVHGQKVVMRRRPWAREYIDADGVAERVE